MGFISQVYSLVKKNFILFRRGWCGSGCEILFPLFLMSMVVLIRYYSTVGEEIDPTYYLGANATEKSEAYYVEYKGKGTIPEVSYKNYIYPTDPFSICWEGEIPGYIISSVGSHALIDEITANIQLMQSKSKGERGVLEEEEYGNRERRELYGYQDLTFMVFESSGDVEDYTYSTAYAEEDRDDYVEPLCVNIDILEDSNLHLKARLRYHYDEVLPINNIPSTEEVIPEEANYFMKDNTWPFQQYMKSGFTYLLNLIQNYVLQNSTGDSGAYISMAFVPMPIPSYTNNQFLENFAGFLPFFIVIMLIPSFYRTISKVVLEKVYT